MPRTKPTYRKRLELPSNASAYPLPEEHRTSGPSRPWLVGLLVFSVLFTAVALFIRYEFESLQDTLRSRVQGQIERYFQSSSISLVGLRGVRIEDFAINHTTRNGTAVAVEAPTALVLVDVMDLLAGAVTVDRVQLDDATIRVVRPPTSKEVQAEAPSAVPPPEVGADDPVNAAIDSPAAEIGPTVASGPFSSGSFRVTGAQCRVELTGFLPDRTLRFSAADFDAYRPAGAPDCTFRLSAVAEASEPIPFEVRGRLASWEDFDVEASTGPLTPALLDEFLAEPQSHVQAGTVQPRVRLQGRPGRTLAAVADAAVEGLAVAKAPEGFPPFTGALHAEGLYSLEARRLTLSRLEVQGETLAAEARGTVDWGGESPGFAVDADLTRLPVDMLLSYLDRTPLKEYGEVDLALEEPYDVRVSASGSWLRPSLTVGLRAPGGSFDFTPREKKWPRARLALGLVQASWDTAERIPKGTLSVVGGTISHKDSGIEAEDVSGTVRFDGPTLTVYPLQARVTGNTCAARLEYDIEKKSGTLDLAGALSNIEDTRLAKSIPNTVLAGSASIRGRAVKKGDSYDISAHVDATDTDIAYRWYFDKKPGLGTGGDLTLALRPRKSLRIEGDIHVAATPIHFVLNSNYTGGKYRLQTITAESDHVDVAGVGRCLTLPYRISGGTGTNARHVWTRRSVEDRTWESTTSCRIDEVFLKAEPIDALMHFRGVDLQVFMDKAASPSRGRIVLAADEARMPPLRTEWFVPVKPDPEQYPDHKPEFRHWTYTLTGKSVEVPPWKGTDFTGEAFTTPGESGLTRYSATVDAGRIEGSFTKDRIANAYVSHTRWSDVPAPYFLEYLRMSPYLTGASSGDITYSLDRDDPNTIDGRGRFEVRNGKFSEDFLYSKLQGEGSSEPVALPPSLRFSLLKSNVEFQRDVVRTPNVVLESEGIQITGGGQFIIDGDMNYDINVSISPQMAGQIPMLTQYFNVEGHRLAQQNIELAFKVTGPTGGPRGQLAGSPPASVTLVSGALEMTSEAIRVIDTPRKILVDLLKLGGGLVGATK